MSLFEQNLRSPNIWSNVSFVKLPIFLNEMVSLVDPFVPPKYLLGDPGFKNRRKRTHLEKVPKHSIKSHAAD